MKNLIKKLIPWADVDNKIYKLYIKAKKRQNNKYLLNYYYHKMIKKYNCIISAKSEINSPIRFPHPMGIVIGRDAKIGNKVTIYQNVTIGQKDDLFPTIGDNVTIYTGAVVVGNVKIGNNVVIGANSVVLNDIPDNCTVAGVPAKIIKRNMNK